MIFRCESCPYWNNSVQHGNAEADTTGRCQRRAPQADERDHTAVWPFTEWNDGCGEGRAAEPKPDERGIA